MKVNAVMADLGTIKASTEIYEQRLLITGLFNDSELYEEFLARVETVDGIKELYWHVQYMSEKEQKMREEEMLNWVDTMKLDVSVGISLIETAGIADVNLRVADTLSTSFGPHGPGTALYRRSKWSTKNYVHDFTYCT